MPRADSLKMIRGGGMPSYRHHDPGNMYIQFQIEFPTRTPEMSDETKNVLKSILGLPPLAPEMIGHKEAMRIQQQANGMMVDTTEDEELDPLNPPLPPGVLEDDHVLEEVDHNEQRRAQGAATMLDEDEDGVPHGAERMQCASQ
jgi:DnaJ homolog subfamily A member 2